MNTQKIKGTFSSEKDAVWAMEKLKPYCSNMKIFYSGYEDYANHEDYGNYTPGEQDTTEPNLFRFGGFGLNMNWNFNPYLDEEKYNDSPPGNYRSQPVTGRAKVELEADIQEDDYEYVKEKFYFYGAQSVR